MKTRDGKVYKDSLYSPYAQNQRGASLLTSFLSEKFRDVKVDHFVVFANNRSILKKGYAPKEIQEKVIKLDQLILKLKEDFRNSSSSCLEKTMKGMAELITSCHEEAAIDYMAKFKITEDDFKVIKTDANGQEVVSVNNKSDEAHQGDLYEALKVMRLKLAKDEGVPAYYIFNNMTLDELTEKKPMNKEELMKVFGFSEVKAAKYGNEVVRVVRENI